MCAESYIAENRQFNVHRPVLAKQVVAMLAPCPGDVVWDLTMGAAGHSALLLEQVQPGGFLLGVDRDPQIAEMAIANLEHNGWKQGPDFETAIMRFSHITNNTTFSENTAKATTKRPDIVLADLGVSSLQLDEANRGFSFRNDGPLTMLMNSAEPGTRTAADIVNTASAGEIEQILTEFGEERWAKRIALKIVEAREIKPFETTRELRDVVAGAVPRKAWPPNTDVATRTFQALRIAVNEEFFELDTLLANLPALLSKPGSRAGIISFHSLEDRRVKQAFRAMTAGCNCPRQFPQCVCGRIPEFALVAPQGGAKADENESDENPRARSARLRVIKRIAYNNESSAKQ